MERQHGHAGHGTALSTIIHPVDRILLTIRRKIIEYIQVSGSTQYVH